MKKNMIIFLLSALLLTFFVSYFLIRKNELTRDVIKVGMMSGWAPFMTINNQGQYEGFDVDVAQKLAQRMNKTVVIQDLGSLASCFVALEQGMVDMVLSGLDITQKRRDTLAMVYYTGDNVKNFDLVFWDTIPATISSMKDLRFMSGAIICAESGSAQEKFLDQYSFVTKKRINSVTDGILDIRFGKSLALILEPRIAQRLQKQSSELKRLAVPLPEEFQVFGCGIALKKDNAVLATEVENVIQSMLQDGTIKQLEIKWQLEE